MPPRADRTIVRYGWKEGPAPPGGPAVVSMTRFAYAGLRHIPAVALHAWRLRRAWGSRDGAIGLFVGGERLRPVTYSMSAWATEEHLRSFLGSPEHLRLVRRFRPRLASSTSVVWTTEHLVPEAAWEEGHRRLAGQAGHRVEDAGGLDGAHRSRSTPPGRVEPRKASSRSATSSGASSWTK